MSIKRKLIIYILTAITLVYAPLMAYLGIKNKNDFYQVGSERIDLIGKQYATKIEEDFNKYFTLLKTISAVNSNIEILKNEDRSKCIIENYKKILINNPNIDGVWDSWDFFTYDSLGNKIEKRTSYTAERYLNKIITKKEIKEISKLYDKIRKNNSDEYVVEPYLYSFSGNKKDEVLVTSLSEKMYKGSKQVGIVGIDISLKSLQKILSKIDNINSAEVELLSQNGQFLSHPESEMIGQYAFNKNDTLLKKILKNEQFSFIKEIDGEEYFSTYIPIKLGKFDKHWTLVINIPKSVIEEKAIDNLKLTFIIGFIGLILLSMIIIFITSPIVSPLRNIIKIIQKLSVGNIKNITKVHYKSNDEIGDISKALNKMIDDIEDKTHFAEEIGKNNFNTKLKNINPDDTLGEALRTMRDNLIKAKELEQQQKNEEEKRNWIHKGEALFSEILRTNNNLQELSDNILKNLVSYLGANQGAFYLVDDKNEEKTLNLVSAFAYDRKKFIEKQILFGEGLVGTCAIEGLSIYLTEIPENYINISSGLGKANPRSLLLVPMKTDTDLIGVIEIASFKEIENYQREFVEKIAETIASAIITVKINEKTAQLLEQTRQQAEEMQAQEEEMRQNLEELQATQEEADRKAKEMHSFIESLKEANFFVEYDANGVVIDVNDKLLNLLGIKRENAIGLHHKDYLVLTKEQEEIYAKFWEDLRNGISQKVIFEVDIKGKKHSFNENYIPIKDVYGEVVRVIKISNLTDEYQKK